jgi:glycosyltransferase involved in cell wall biosynthesis
MSLPTLSVVLPNFNDAHVLPRALDAILAQSVPALEIIIIDDASTDNSREVIAEYARKHSSIRLEPNEKNCGIMHGMNKGLRLARGEFLVYAAADDEILPGLFEKSLKLLAQHPKGALCCSISDWWDEKTGFNWHMGVGMADRPAYLSPAELFELEKRGRMFVAGNTCLFRKAPLVEAGEFIQELKWHCDWFAIEVVAFRYGICYVPEPLGKMNLRPRSYHNAGVKQKLEYQDLLLHLLKLLGSEKYADVQPYFRDSGAMFLFGSPIREILRKNPEYHQYLTPNFRRKNRMHIFKLWAKQYTPRWAADLYFRLAGYRAKAPSGNSKGFVTFC